MLPTIIFFYFTLKIQDKFFHEISTLVLNGLFESFLIKYVATNGSEHKLTEMFVESLRNQILCPFFAVTWSRYFKETYLMSFHTNSDTKSWFSSVKDKNPELILEIWFLLISIAEKLIEPIFTQAFTQISSKNFYEKLGTQSSNQNDKNLQIKDINVKLKIAAENLNGICKKMRDIVIDILDLKNVLASRGDLKANYHYFLNHKNPSVNEVYTIFGTFFLDIALERICIINSQQVIELFESSIDTCVQTLCFIYNFRNSDEEVFDVFTQSFIYMIDYHLKHPNVLLLDLNSLIIKIF